MQAQDIMTTNVITVYPDASIQYIAKRLIENRISAVPVVEMDGRLAGIVSEGDLMRRSESGTERHSSPSPSTRLQKIVSAPPGPPVSTRWRTVRRSLMGLRRGATSLDPLILRLTPTSRGAQERWLWSGRRGAPS